MRCARRLGSNAYNLLILSDGAKWKRLSVTAKDAQLLERLSYSAVDVARIFGMPPHMIDESDKAEDSRMGTGNVPSAAQVDSWAYTYLHHVAVPCDYLPSHSITWRL